MKLQLSQTGNGSFWRANLCRDGTKKFDDVFKQPDPTEGLKKLVDPRLGDNCPIDLVMKMAQLTKVYTENDPQKRPNISSVMVTLTALISTTEDWNIVSIIENPALVNLIVKAAIDRYKKACSDSSGARYTSEANAQMRGGEALWELAKKTYGAFASSKRENRHFTDMADLNFQMCKAMENPGLTPSFSLRTF
ncbi:hypothetical protein RJT34_02121 [Clitoria ternatea]|uniref:Uncharacterized protein n=1 Tax=Clitoria ternatea TaxID=43366 RepID=A0AAN9Q0T0_CLITE